MLLFRAVSGKSRVMELRQRSKEESSDMKEPKGKTIALNVRLKPSAHPLATNYTNVGVAQGIAYVDFGFIEPVLLGAIAKTAKDGQATLK
jgi:hypothetical protein